MSDPGETARAEVWEMSAILGPNRLRERSDDPTHRGHCIIGDQSFLILGWRKQDSGGEAFLHLSFRDLEEIGEPE